MGIISLTIDRCPRFLSHLRLGVIYLQAAILRTVIKVVL